MYRAFRPLLFMLDPETAHGLVFGTAGLSGGLGRALCRLTMGGPEPRLRTRLGELELPGPVGLAAGLDKEGDLAPLWAEMGFGFVELGTVTAHAQPGNPRPRLFRFPKERALINRMGFNNRGSAALAERLGRMRERSLLSRAPIGANIGKSKVTPLEEAASDYSESARRLAALADYLVVNVSSPNTPGLRDLQDPGALAEIVAAVCAEAGEKPVWVKLAPDLSDEAIEQAVSVAHDSGAAAIVASNTTIERHGLEDPGPGGLSGAPLRPRSLEVISLVARCSDLPVVGVGGISTAEHVLDAVAAGASAVQVLTALIYEGPGLVGRINRALTLRMDEEGLESFEELRRWARRRS